MLPYLGFNKFNGFLNLIQDGAFESDILDNVHICTNFFINAVVSDEACAGTGEELLRILAKEKNASCTNCFLALLIGRNKTIVLLEVLLRVFGVTYQINVFCDCFYVDVVSRGSMNSRVFEEAFAFVIHQLHPLVKTQFAALVAYTHECLIRLIGM